MPAYRTWSNINYGAPVVIQMATTGLQFSNAVGPDALLVYENGIWKFPRESVAALGAIRIPNSTASHPQKPVRVMALQAAWGAGATWNMQIHGNPANTSGTLYPSGDSALYTEGSVTVASGTGAFNITEYYDTRALFIMPGQTLALTCSGATNPIVRLYFEPAEMLTRF